MVRNCCFRTWFGKVSARVTFRALALPVLWQLLVFVVLAGLHSGCFGFFEMWACFGFCLLLACFWEKAGLDVALVVGVVGVCWAC